LGALLVLGSTFLPSFRAESGAGLCEHLLEPYPYRDEFPDCSEVRLPDDLSIDLWAFQGRAAGIVAVAALALLLAPPASPPCRALDVARLRAFIFVAGASVLVLVWEILREPGGGEGDYYTPIWGAWVAFGGASIMGLACAIVGPPSRWQR
jgi:hypothetical protein